MKPYLVTFIVKRGVPLPIPLPPVPIIEWATEERLTLRITARDADDACHLVGRRYCNANRLTIVCGPHFVSSDIYLSHSPDHFSTSPPELICDLAISSETIVPTHFVPVSFLVTSITPA